MVFVWGVGGILLKRVIHRDRRRHAVCAPRHLISLRFRGAGAYPPVLLGAVSRNAARRMVASAYVAEDASLKRRSSRYCCVYTCGRLHLRGIAVIRATSPAYGNIEVATNINIAQRLCRGFTKYQHRAALARRVVLFLAARGDIGSWFIGFRAPRCASP